MFDESDNNLSRAIKSQQCMLVALAQMVGKKLGDDADISRCWNSAYKLNTLIAHMTGVQLPTIEQLNKTAEDICELERVYKL